MLHLTSWDLNCDLPVQEHLHKTTDEDGAISLTREASRQPLPILLGDSDCGDVERRGCLG